MLPKILFIMLTSTLAFADIVSISPTSIDFGDRFVGVFVYQYIPVTLSNPTKKVLNISSITTPGIYNTGAVRDVTNFATWSSASASIATIAPTGVATAVAQGTSTITALIGTVSGSATLNVGPPVLVSMFVSPTSATVKKGNSLQLAATGVYSNHSTTDLTAATQWTSLSQPVATVSSSGLVSGISPGTTTIQAPAVNLS